MKSFMIIVSLAALAKAEPPSTYSSPRSGARYQQSEPAYGLPTSQINYAGPSSLSNYAAPSFNQGYSAPQGGYSEQYVPKTYRHVHIYSAPDEPTYAENKVIRVPGGGDKHVNIIFVKAPSQSSNQQTEVILPEQAQQKTVVYVLVKKQENTNNVKVTAPAQQSPQKPEVFFIRYKNKEQAAQAYGPPSFSGSQSFGGGGGGGGYSAPLGGQGGY